MSKIDDDTTASHDNAPVDRRGDGSIPAPTRR